MAGYLHYYKWFGCGKKYQAREVAVSCCAVVQELWQCTACGNQAASETRAIRHQANHPTHRTAAERKLENAKPTETV